jgi:hypothetical protein
LSQPFKYLDKKSWYITSFNCEPENENPNIKYKQNICTTWDLIQFHHYKVKILEFVFNITLFSDSERLKHSTFFYIAKIC